MSSVRCPICRNSDGAQCVRVSPQTERIRFECDRCGPFNISDTALDDSALEGLGLVQRAALSHRIRTQFTKADLLTTVWLNQNREKLKLPSPAKQVANLIRIIGERKLATGEDTPVWVSLVGEVGCFGEAELHELVRELTEQKSIGNRGSHKVLRRSNAELHTSRLGLTLQGWREFEAEQRGEFGGGFGFLALKFGDEQLDDFVAQNLKPVVKAELKLDIVDMRDVGRAGLIDNIMRAQIRDSAFVIADLTHDNYGAYWEAGYAEGLGKPVIYICERKKFEAAKTHFDTNHSTTVPWSTDDPGKFREEIIATLRRSLGLF